MIDYEDFPKLLSEISLNNEYYVENEFTPEHDDDYDDDDDNTVSSEFDYESLFVCPHAVQKLQRRSSGGSSTTEDLTDSSLSSTSISSSEEDPEAQNKKRRHVSFSTVEVREYNIIVGDHPFCKGGLPISLDWGYKGKRDYCLNAYEENRMRLKDLRQSRIKQISSSPKKLDYRQRKQRLAHVAGVTKDRSLPPVDMAKKYKLANYR
mmetsp:Transcript_2954/g.4446  ORF Transcript_2954/g.4446 Transcript_2954/m.4446 type:complete len:207 (+) Transcript_2954:326-946(+)|eukprot:CAMPEP_0194224008 /NCGR_PEP_ID=MMETSP0156-20130528/36481_1 /TAXON_ID=33649 /ORGANISM="Thalassionema nitzschioides, Strain L26-B" /LENGTH=206 /DNA_ID=CAMNT_0038955379 /DNA_START=354 /DNA_END=974 /DNA_ORIENTATION=-